MSKKADVKKDAKKQQPKKQENKKEPIKKVEKEPATVIKKEEKRKETVTAAPVTSNEMGNLIKIILIVTALFLIFYFITVLVTDNGKKNSGEETEPTIQYDEILLGNLFTQPTKEYYVLVADEEDDNLDVYYAYLSAYKSKENALRYYTVDLNSAFNNMYKAEKANYTNNIKELKLKGTTLIKIKDKKIVATYDTEDKITTQLKNMIK